MIGPAYTITPALSGIPLPLLYDPVGQRGIQVVAFDGGEPGTANLLVDQPATYNGDLYRGFTLPAREVVLGLYVAGVAPADFLALRDGYLAATPLGTAVVLSATRLDGVVRTIAGVVVGNTSGSDDQSVGPYWQSFSLAVHCSSPFWLGPASTTTFSVLAGKSFFGAPFFPVLLQGASINQGATLVVGGTQPAPPIWTITGPFTSPLVLSLPGGPSLTLNYTAQPGEIITIDTRPGVQGVRTALGANLYTYLSPGSQLFALPVGTTSVTAAVNGATAATTVALTFTGQWQSV